MWSWVKRNKLTTLLLVIGAYFLFGSAVRSLFLPGLNFVDRTSRSAGSRGVGAPGMVGMEGLAAPIADTFSKSSVPEVDYAPQPGVEDRLVIETSNLSLLVKDVVDVRNKIVAFAEQAGGYMVSANVSNPQDAPTATVVVRIPSAQLDEALDYFHSLSVKVVSENLSGRDVTDQYIDIEKRIEIVERTMVRMEAILAEAREVSDLIRLNKEIINLQNSIDNLRGQQQSLEQNAALAKLTIYLSTDEIVLPYAPSETFRPSVIFKTAVRSLVGNLRDLAATAIWIGVYAVLWVPGLLIILAFRSWWQRRRAGSA